MTGTTVLWQFAFTGDKLLFEVIGEEGEMPVYRQVMKQKMFIPRSIHTSRAQFDGHKITLWQSGSLANQDEPVSTWSCAQPWAPVLSPAKVWVKVKQKARILHTSS